MDRLGFNLKDDFLVLRVNIHSDLGKDMLVKYRGVVVPSFIVFDKRGHEVWRHSGSVPALETILSLDV